MEKLCDEPVNNYGLKGDNYAKQIILTKTVRPAIFFHNICISNARLAVASAVLTYLI